MKIFAATARSVALNILLLLAFLMGGPEAAAQRFDEVTSLLGDVSIDVPRRVSGASSVDVNNDGLIDIYRYRKLYVQQPDGRFQDRLTSSGISDVLGTTQGAIWGDYDNDGFLDVFVPNTDQESELYHNQRTGFFRRSNGVTGVSIPTGGVGAIFGDFDLDGLLDLFTARTSGNNSLLLGRESHVFRDRTPVANIGGLPEPCGIAVSDVDHNGLPDIYTSSCNTAFGSRTDHLLTNQGSGIFRDSQSISPGANGAITRASVFADFNRDGWEDLYVGNNFPEPPQEGDTGLNRLYLNNGGVLSLSQHIGEGRGGALDQTWALAAADFDNDGWVDIYISNRDTEDGGPGVHQLLHNNGDGTFTDVFFQAFGISDVPPAAAVTVADFNSDGWVDLFWASTEGDRLFYNRGGQNHWLDISLTGKDSNKNGIGARVIVSDGSGVQESQIRTGDAVASQNMNNAAHFGLGSVTSGIDVTVIWPVGGVVEMIENVSADQSIRIVEGLGRNDEPVATTLSAPQAGQRIDLSDGPITFEWNPVSDRDGDTISYNLYLTGPGVDTVFVGLAQPTFTVSPDFLSQRQNYSWTVAATDGHTVRSSSEVRSFRFGGTTVAEPVRMNYVLAGIHSGSVSFGDYDGDSDPDLLVVGSSGRAPVAKVYQAVDTLFTETEFDIPFPIYRDTQAILKKVDDALAEWTDYDGDGDLDILLAGKFEADGQARLVTEIYENIDLVFTQNFGIQLPGVISGAADWGDYDGDGDLDLALTGGTEMESPYAPISKIFRNDGGTFTDIGAPLTRSIFGDVDWGDIDGDGDLDLVVSGQSAPGRFETHAYVNDGSGNFTASSIAFPGLAFGSVSFGDMDHDGDEDLLLTGGTVAPDLVRGAIYIYRNDSPGLVSLNAGRDIVGTAFGKADWLDYDGDGDLDILVTGAPDPLGERSAWVYRNEESIRFAEEFKLSGLLFSDISFADFFSDGDLDFVVGGLDAAGVPSVFFFANMLRPEQIPTALSPR